MFLLPLGAHAALHCLPTRRSSDLADAMTGIFATIMSTGNLPDGATMPSVHGRRPHVRITVTEPVLAGDAQTPRSEEHTSELQSRGHLVCRLLLEKKNRNQRQTTLD